MVEFKYLGRIPKKGPTFAKAGTAHTALDVTEISMGIRYLSFFKTKSQVSNFNQNTDILPERVSRQYGPTGVVSALNFPQMLSHIQHTHEPGVRECGGVSSSLSYHETSWCIPCVGMLLSCPLHHSSVSSLSFCDQV